MKLSYVYEMPREVFNPFTSVGLIFKILNLSRKVLSYNRIYSNLIIRKFKIVDLMEP